VSESFAFSGVSTAVSPLLAVSVLVEVLVFAAGLFVETIFGRARGTDFVIGLTLTLGAAAFGLGTGVFLGLTLSFFLAFQTGNLPLASLNLASNSFSSAFIFWTRFQKVQVVRCVWRFCNLGWNCLFVSFRFLTLFGFLNYFVGWMHLF